MSIPIGRMHMGSPRLTESVLSPTSETFQEKSETEVEAPLLSAESQLFWFARA